MLYHYTTVEGLLGIVKEEKIRASEIGFLSDMSEYKYAMKLIEKTLHEMSTPVSDATVSPV